eukprot:COSAG01_NODE_61882_length_287_cov_0.973404_1_plen_65_part_01
MIDVALGVLLLLVVVVLVAADTSLSTTTATFSPADEEAEIVFRRNYQPLGAWGDHGQEASPFFLN